MVAPADDLAVGQVFTRFTVTGPAEKRGKYLYIPVRCECGVEKYVEKTTLRKGKSRSCGCLNAEVVRARCVTHGKAGTPIYYVWNTLVQRTCNKNSKSYPDYGGRGITIPEKWKTFEGFYADMGDPPFEGASIDRVDNNAPYSKENCRWATREQQNNNTRRNVKWLYKGVEHTLKELAEIAGLGAHTMRSRLYIYGMTPEEAVERPLQH